MEEFSKRFFTLDWLCLPPGFLSAASDFIALGQLCIRERERAEDRSQQQGESSELAVKTAKNDRKEREALFCGLDGIHETAVLLCGFRFLEPQTCVRSYTDSTPLLTISGHLQV